MNIKFTIKGRLAGLNEYTSANRTNRYAGANMKRTNENIVIESIYEAKLQKVYKYPIKLKITWYEPNSRRDVDNIRFGAKFILDSMVKCGIIEDDSQKYVNSITDDVKVDKENPRIEVEIIEREKNV